MLNVFRKAHLSLLPALLLTIFSSPLMAWECCEPECNRLYVGAFGGGILPNSTNVTQLGTALFTEAEGGPLAVDAHGSTNKTQSGFGGVQVGYEWRQCSRFISPAAELEGYWFRHTKQGHLFNAADLDRLPEHDFLNTFPIRAGVYLANAVFSLNCWCVAPYVGLGIGATRISIRNATSEQVAPPEIGINHFNSGPSDASWAFAAQLKAGLKYRLCNFLHVFGEYRYLFVDFSNYIFGSTVYPTHAHTTPWNVKFQNMQYNAFAFGIQFDL